MFPQYPLNDRCCNRLGLPDGQLLKTTTLIVIGAALWHEVKIGLPPPFIAAHPLHQSFRVALLLIDASTADVKMVKFERIDLQNILSSNHTAYCLQIELSE